MLPQGSRVGEVVRHGRAWHGFVDLGGRQAAVEPARDVQGSHRQRRTLLLQQSYRRVLKCRPIPYQCLVGEAESHEPISLDAADSNPQNIGQLMQGVHAPGHGRGPGVKATVDQLSGGLRGVAHRDFDGGGTTAWWRGLDTGGADQRTRQHRRAGEQEQARAKKRPQQHRMKQLYAQTKDICEVRPVPCLNRRVSRLSGSNC